MRREVEASATVPGRSAVMALLPGISFARRCGLPLAPMTDEPHSALYLTDARDLWWNADFLALLARRADFTSVRHALDVGAGQGHWTRTVARLLPKGASIVGVEREPRWVELAARAPPVDGVPVSYQVGGAERMPFADASFDLVTCQTLLIHVADPRAVVAEMTRVLRPGGRLLLCEPNNIAASVSRLVTSPSVDVDDLVAALTMQARCERGKAALGRGFDSAGETLVSLLDPALVDDVQVWLNDRCTVYAPGTDRGSRTELADDRRLIEVGPLGWSLDDTRRYFVAGGGDEAAFDGLCARVWRIARARLDGLVSGRASQNEGGLFYVLCARRRA